MFENPDDYKTLQKAVFEYAKTKGEYDTRRKELEETYKGVNANIDNELTSDLVGDYLFTDEEFVKHLSKNRNIFQKIYDKIKYLYKMATAGSKEKRQLEKVKHTFEKVYQNNKADIDGNVKYSTKAGKNSNKFTGNSALSFSEQVDKWKNGEISKDTHLVIFKETPELYQKIGLENLPITLTANKLERVYNKNGKQKGKYHGMEDNIKKLPYALAHPLDIVESSTDKDSIVVVTDLSDMNNNIVIASMKVKNGIGQVEINGMKKSIDVNVVTSVYGRENYDYQLRQRKDGNFIGWMEENFQNNRIIYDIDDGIKKQRVNGQWVSSPDPNNSLSANNVPQSNTNVNSSTTKYSISKTEKNTNELDDSSFSLNKNAKRYDDLIKTNYIEYFRKDNGDVEVYLMDSNNNIVNDLTLWSNTNAIKELGENLGNKIYETATNANQRIEISNDINNIGKDTDYFMNHRPSEGYGNASNFEENMPDVFEHPEWYLNLDEKYNRESLNALKKVRKNPEAELTIYRATIGNKINAGDWVTPSKSYAEYHNNSQFNGEGNILEMKVKAKDIQFAGDDINEFGYFPTNETKHSLSQKGSVNNLSNSDITSDDVKLRKAIAPYTKEIKELKQEVKSLKTLLPKPEKKQEKNTINSDIEKDNGVKVSLPKKYKTPKDSGEVAEILETMPDKAKEKSGIKETLVTKIVDKGYYIDKLARKYNNPELSAKYDYSLMANGVANQIIGIGRQNLKTGEKIGKSLYEVFEPVENANLVKEFSEYLYHKHNIDRMNLIEKYDEDNKPVFGASVTAKESKKIVHDYEIEYPEFLSWAKDVYDYNNANLDMLVENGVISQDDKKYYNEKYPHYVPVVRDNSKNKVQYDILPGKKASVHSPIKKAKGGNQNLIPLKDAMAIRTMQTSNSALRNNFGKELYSTLYGDINEISENTGLDENIIDGFDDETNIITPSDRENHATFTVFNNGKKITMEIDDEIYEALKSSNVQTIDLMNKLNNFKRGVLTEFNPLFWITNPVKDIQDGFINSKHPTGFIKNLPLAIKEVITKGKDYQLYIANGGSYETYFNYNKGTNIEQSNKILPTRDNVSLKTVFGIVPKSISAMNNVIELTPRMAEFISSRKAGDSVEKSVYNAQEVTTNFKRGGDWTKTLDRNGATFLNASMQGMAKQVRNLQEGRQVRVAVSLVVKFAIIGGVSQILNNMIWDDDDDYEKLSNYVKNNYYIVGKYGDGKFIRIPKGRVASAIQMVLDDAISLCKGEKVDLQELWEQLENQVMVSNVVESNIFTPLTDAINNKTWYGENLIPTRLENVPDKEQYDETTDSISIWLGDKLNLSPYKINYFLNQTSGVIGDLILPMLTKQAETDADTISGQIVAPLRDKFTADSVNNTQLVSDIYDLRDELAKKKNSTDATAKDILKYKYIYNTAFGLSDYYKEKREIQSSDKTNREKIKETRKIQKKINEMIEEALSTYEDVEVDGNTGRVGKLYYKKNKNGEWVKQRK